MAADGKVHDALKRIRIRTRLWLLLLTAFIAFSSIILLIHSTVETTRELASEIASEHISQVLLNAQRTRELAEASSDINVLQHDLFLYSFSFGIPDFVQNGERILTKLEQIEESILDTKVKAQFSSYTSSFGDYLGKGARVNRILANIREIDSLSHRELDALEQVISTWMIESALSGKDENYVDQLLALVTGYRESLLIIGKLLAGQELQLIAGKSISSRVIAELHDLHLRLQTITASTPQISAHGLRLASLVDRYRAEVDTLRQELVQLAQLSDRLSEGEKAIHGLIANLDASASRDAKNIRDYIDLLISETWARVTLFSMLIVVVFGLYSVSLIRRHIDKPLAELIHAIGTMRFDRLSEPIAMNRNDEWGAIEDALNRMGKTLLKTYQELIESKQSFQRLVDSVPGVVFRSKLDSQWTVIYVSDPIEELTGYTSEELVSNRDITYAEVIHPEDREMLTERVVDAIERNTSYSIEYRIVRRDGEVRWVFERGGLAHEVLEDGERILEGVLVDITEEKRLSQDLTESQLRYRLLLEHSTEGIFGLDANGYTTFINPAAAHMLGYEPHEMLQKRFHEQINLSRADGIPLAESEWRMLLPTRDGQDYHVDDELMWRRDGTRFPVEYWSTPIRNNGDVLGTVVTYHDISERRENEKEIQHLAFHDMLTSLPNRTLFNEGLRYALAEYHRYGKLFALHILDLDHFKEVNDSLGHPVGDKLLQQVAERLRAVIRETDILARLGGDEFGVIQSDLLDSTDASLLSAKVIDVVKEAFQVDGNIIHINTSIGIFVPEKPDVSLDEVLSNADVALYKAKDAGRGLFTFFGDAMSVQMYREMTLARDLAAAIENREFFLEYQPQFRAGSDELVGIEALVRWQHPERGRLMPGDFIPMAEKRGFIKTLSDWVLEQACQQARRWRDRKYLFGRIAVNLSAKQVSDEKFEENIKQIIERTGIPAEYIELEFTETVLMDATDSTRQAIERLSEQGIQFAIDDFGTGFSSLSYLRQFHADKLKIDQEFIRDVITDRNDAEIVKATIALGKVLGLELVAEGVETQEQLEFLLENQCDVVQGFLYGRPQPSEELEKRFLMKDKNLPSSHEIDFVEG